MENIHLWYADRGTYFDRNVNIITWSDDYKIVLGKYNSIGRDCNFFLHSYHRGDWVTTSSQLLGPVTPEIAEMHMKMGHPTCKGDIIVENDVWIGMNVMIMSGVKIGSGSVIGAGSVISKDVEPYSIVVGNPAKVIKKRFTDDQIDIVLKSEWWNWDHNFIRENSEIIFGESFDKFEELTKLKK